jgi:uncharacterized phage-associated protein
LLEESAIKKYGIPFLGLPFKVWKFGPVLKDVYVDLSEDNLPLLGTFIKRADHDSKIFEANAPFNDDYFSDNEIKVLEMVATFAKHKVAKDLVDVTHEENALWYKTAQSHGVYQALVQQQIPTTDYTIDFSLLFDNDPIRRESFLESAENFDFMMTLKE